MDAREIEAIRRWAGFAGISNYQRYQIIALCDEATRLRAASGAPDARVAKVIDLLVSANDAINHVSPRSIRSSDHLYSAKDRIGRAIAALRDTPATPAPDAGRVAMLRFALKKAVSNIEWLARHEGWLPVTDGIVAGMLLDIEDALRDTSGEEGK